VKFLLDVHHIGSRATGNETWARETTLAMAGALRPESNERLYACVATPIGEMFGPSVGIERVGTGSLRRLAVDIPSLVRQRNIDSVLVQYTAPLTTRPVVVAIHDLSFTSPASRSWIPPRERARMQSTIKWSARRARTVVALSQSTATDLQEQWGIPAEKIVVAPPAVSPQFSARLRSARIRTSEAATDEARILVVGNVLPRKNHIVVARAVKRLRDSGLRVSLRIAGQVPTAGEGVAREIHRVGGDWTTVTGYLDDDSLVTEFLRADVLCYPSLYEGFGIPVLEGMAAGLPVLVSDATALPEAAGDAGLILPPHDVDAWADALIRVLTDPAFAQSLADLGHSHEQRFTWERTAEVVIDALRSAAS